MRDANYWCVIYVLLLGSACNTTTEAQAEPGIEVARLARELPEARSAQYTTTVHTPARLVSVNLSSDDSAAVNGRVACETCHALRQDAPLPTSMDKLTRFHQGMRLEHGSLTCASCHAAGQPPELKLADGTPVATRDALALCAQCHGAQFRDYKHNAHGGLNGYWDQTRGPRLKNHCVDCHDPHHPAMTPVQPMPPPRDRFFERKSH